MQETTRDDDLVMSLVELALARPSGERESYLRSVCPDDPELFDQVLQYVEWDERMDGFLLDPLYSVLSEQHFETGDVLDGRFRIVREVAQGGMGVVYEAWDEKLERRIAVKCAKAGFRKRLPPEVRNARDITHPNVCKIFEIHTASTQQGEIDFLAMEFLDGQTLAERLHQGPFPKEEATGIARQLCAGLAEAHRNGVIHGDLKSGNVILTQGTDGALRTVITDFGLARRPEASRPTAQSGEAVGTPDYMAPELLRGEKASTASDVYALGVILHELAYRRRPAVVAEEGLTTKGPAVHPKWGHILARCLEADPARRFRDGAEVAQALAPPRSRRWLLGAAAAIALAIATGIGTYQRATAPQETVRLAVLPFEADADTKPLSEGLLLDAGQRLSHLKAGHLRLTLVPLSDALQHKVNQPANARTMLGATHSLSGVFRQKHGRTLVSAYLINTRSLVPLTQWQAEYSPDELRNLPVALAGMVTGTLRLRPLAVAATVNSAAYADYVAGDSLARRSDGVDRALPLLERAVAADRDSPLTHAKLAETQWTKFLLTSDRQWADRAAASLKNSEQRNPDVALVRIVAGMIHDYFGEYPQAQMDLTRAVELDPLNADGWWRLARVYEHSNQPNLALEAYRRAIDVQPGYFRNYEKLASFYFNRNDYEETIRQAKKMVELAPDLADSHYALAAPYLNLGRYSDAEYELSAAIRFQETANAVVALGLVYAYQGRDREAIPHFERAIKIGPATSISYVNLGTARRRAGLALEAEQAYRKGRELAEAALAANPGSGSERASLAYLCARLGDRQRAQSEAAQALQSSGKANNVRWMVAQTYEALGQRDHTLEVVRDAPATLLDRLSRLPDLADLSADSRFQKLLASREVR